MAHVALAKKNAQRLAPRLLDWFSRNARDLPWRRTRDPYAIWVSEIMLQQTQVKTVVPYWERWMRELPTIHALAEVRPEKILKLWEGLGYYTRARNLQRAARQILKCHRGQFPEQFDDVLALPGIGRYTAGAICSIAFNQPRPVVDGNVIRVLTRLFGIAGDPHDRQINEQLWTLAAQLVAVAAHCASRLPPSALSISGPCSALNQSLMEFGATLCTPRQPKCGTCPLRRDCVARRQGLVEQLPVAKSRATSIVRRFGAFVLEHRGCFLVRRRPAGTVNGRLWEFPNIELSSRDFTPATEAAELVGGPVRTLNGFCTVKHTITRYRITLEVYRGIVSNRPRRRNQQERWYTLEELERLPLTSAHGKIRQQLAASAAPTVRPRENPRRSRRQASAPTITAR